MSNYNNNNANMRIVQMIQQLQQWNKKPSLNDRISDFLNIFHESINKERITFAEAGLFLQESSILNCKQIDLLYKGFLECHKNLSQVYNDKPKEEEIPINPIVEPNNAEKNIVDAPEPEKSKKERKKHETKKPEEDAQTVEEIPPDLTNPEPEKLSIPGIPDDILEKLKLSDCLPGGPIDEFIDKLDQNHPLYSIISKLGKEISQNKDIFTYHNLSLSGMSWNALFKIEEVVSRITRKDQDLDQNENQVFDQCQQTQTDDDSGICTDDFISGMTTGTSENLDNTEPPPGETLVETQIQPVENTQIAKPNEEPPPIILTPEMKKHIVKECVEKVVKINLLKLDFKMLTKKFNFRLPPEYFAERKSERIRKRKNMEENTSISVKRKKNEDPTPKQQQYKHKSFDLEYFENFCYDYYESQGIIIPRPQPIEINRKSVDNRSEVSYGNPLTPADSGRFSISFMTDSEFEHDESCRDSAHPFSRADSGIEVMGPFSPGSDHQDDLPETEICEEQNDTLKTLRALFPATFSDPQRAEALKALYKQPEDDENYMQWKKFIDEKTANEQEFNIHEYGTDILNSFSMHSTDKLNFETIVNDKSVGDISRYFVSTLQLANTYNLEIVDKYPGEIRPDNMQLKFLTNTRAHEEIDSHFNDISEDHFMDTLMTNRSKYFHSTPLHPKKAAPDSGPSSHHKLSKRKRLEYCY